MKGKLVPVLPKLVVSELGAAACLCPLSLS